jgi:hypothetical protein
VSLTVEQELVVESYGVVRFTSPLVGAEAAENGSLWFVTYCLAWLLLLVSHCPCVARVIVCGVSCRVVWLAGWSRCNSTVTSPLTTIAGWAQGSVTFNGNVEVKSLAKVLLCMPLQHTTTAYRAFSVLSMAPTT